MSFKGGVVFGPVWWHLVVKEQIAIPPLIVFSVHVNKCGAWQDHAVIHEQNPVEIGLMEIFTLKTTQNLSAGMRAEKEI